MEHLTPSRILYSLMGNPPVSYPIRKSKDVCWLCGFPSDEAVDSKKAIGLSFTDHEKVRSPWSKDLCLPCCWVLSGRPPDSFRPWSVVWKEETKFPSNSDIHPNKCVPGVHFTKRNNPAEIIKILLDPPDCLYFCAVALTGKKHTLPFAKINRSNNFWTIRVENHDVSSSPKKFLQIMEKCKELLEAGYSKKEVSLGIPQIWKLARDSSMVWRNSDKFFNKIRGTMLLELALWLIRT